jgi:hypothetical protein
MSRDDKQFRRSALLSFRFLGTAVTGSVLMALVSAFGPAPAQLAILGAFISILGGLFMAYLGQEDERERQRAAAIESLSAPLALASDPELFRLYRAICDGLISLSRRPNGILRHIALLKLTSLSEQVAGLADGKAVFALTESWRTVYERLLASPELKKYRSVAWVRTPDYWQDAPGRQSMQVNFDAAIRGLLIERIIILRDQLWQAEDLLPRPEILPWIKEQHNHGMWITLVRESALAREPGLLIDMGIYGDRAVGIQEVDESGRTFRFTLDTTPQALHLAEDRWQRLSLYAVPLRSLLDRADPKR